MHANAEPSRPQGLFPLRSNEDLDDTASISPLSSTTSTVDAPLARPSPNMALSTRSSWLPILESENNQLVLYNPTSHALTITRTSLLPARRVLYGHPNIEGISPNNNTQLAPIPSRSRSANGSGPAENGDALLSPGLQKFCPWCSRPYPTEPIDHLDQSHHHEYSNRFTRDGPLRRAPNYFKLLEQANQQAQSRPASPPLISDSNSSPRNRLAEVLSPTTPATPERTEAPLDDIGNRPTKLGLNTSIINGGADSPLPGTPKRRFGESSMAQGYFAAFFKEERRLGMGANGSVYLCQHVLDGNYLGHFAVKKIAVGHSHDYLLRILKEVRLLETLRHPNIVSYHHSWLETTRFSSFGPSIPTLHVLMEWAECGSLDDLIDARQGKGSMETGEIGGVEMGNEERIRAFRANRKARGSLGFDAKPRKKGVGAGVHLLSADEIKSFMIDIVSGLAFLHDRSILHLDLKLGNVLLTKDEDRIIPRAMLSDFGTSQDALQGPRIRSGNTGTVEYSAPEALRLNAAGKLQPVDARSDMWSLGMILHKLIFFRLPYPDIDPTDVNGIEREVLAYPGWKAAADPGAVANCKHRGLPRELLILLEGLLSTNPRERPSSERVLSALKDGNLEPPSRAGKRRDASSSRARRGSSSSPSVEHTSFPPESLKLTLLKPSEMVSPPDATDEEDVYQSSPSSPLISKLKHSRRASLNDSLTAIPNLLLPAPVRAFRRNRLKDFRTALLVLKIVSLSRTCRSGYPVIWVQVLVTVLAALDVWMESEEEGNEVKDLRTSAVLCCMHLLLLGIIRWDSRLGLCVP